MGIPNASGSNDFNFWKAISAIIVTIPKGVAIFEYSG
jgi:hypothetical protein